MNLNISGQHMELTDAIKQHVEKKFERVKKHGHDITNAHVICKIEGHTHCTEATLHIPGHEVVAHAKSDDMYKAINMLVDKLITQIDDFHAKDQGH